MVICVYPYRCSQQQHIVHLYQSIPSPQIQYIAASIILWILLLVGWDADDIIQLCLHDLICIGSMEILSLSDSL